MPISTDKTIIIFEFFLTPVELSKMFTIIEASSTFSLEDILDVWRSLVWLYEPWRGVTIIERQLVQYNGGQLRAIYNWTSGTSEDQHNICHQNCRSHTTTNINTVSSLLVTLFCIVNIEHNEHQYTSMTRCPAVRLGWRMMN